MAAARISNPWPMYPFHSHDDPALCRDTVPVGRACSARPPWCGSKTLFLQFFLELFSLVLGHEHSRLEIRTGIFLFLCYVFLPWCFA